MKTSKENFEKIDSIYFNNKFFYIRKTFDISLIWGKQVITIELL